MDGARKKDNTAVKLHEQPREASHCWIKLFFPVVFSDREEQRVLYLTQICLLSNNFSPSS